MRLMATGATDSAIEAIRTETFNGREYTVVPVVAIVEQVLQGLNAATPELAQATAFGKVPDGWNGRPIVLNHPTDANNNLVSANSPEILEAFSMGFMFNTVLDGTKLKAEAWLDNARIKELGGEFESTLNRLLEGKMVEVSVGCYVDITPQKGKFKGASYSGVWENAIPDHLAFLSEGSLGACSVANGCGAPRLNANAPTTKQLHVLRSTLPTPLTVGHKTSGEACCDNCGSHNGEPCMSTNSNTPAPKSVDVVKDGNGTVRVKLGDLSANEGEQENADEGAPSEGSENNAEGAADTTEASVEEAVDEAKDLQGLAGLASHLVANAVPGDMTLDDVQKLVRMALRQKLGRRVYPIAITTDVVVYNSYSYDYDYDYNNDLYYQQSYSIDDKGTVTFSGEPTPVTLKTEIIPTKKTDFSGNEGAGAGEATEGESATNAKEDEMSGNNAENISANGDGQKPVARTAEQYVAEAPAEFQDVLRSSLKLHNDKKASLIKGLMDSGRCKFSETDLQARGLEELENMAALADIKTFEGRAVPSTEGDAATGLSANGRGAKFIPAPQAFEIGSRALGQKASA